MSVRTGGPEAPVHRARGARAARRARGIRELGVLLALALLVAGTALVNPAFLSAQSVRDLLLGATLLCVLAVGQTLVIVTRNVDLSVGSVLGLSAFATGSLFVTFPGLPIPVAALAGVLVGAGCGLVNGTLVTVARVPALVVTLGTLYVFRGVDHWWAAGRQINAADMPREFLDLGRLGLAGIPLPALVAAAVVLATGWYLASYRSGRELYAIGSDPAAARLSGIPVDRRVLAAFVVNGALAGLAGVLYAARFGTLDANAGLGLELQVVAAAVVGGVAIFGGSGTVFGAAVGAVLLTTIGSALAVLRVDPFWQQAVVGLLILVAIGMDRLLAARSARRLRVADAVGGDGRPGPAGGRGEQRRSTS
ncbi:ABC transporter permease [Marinitenerispora sediminis]|uniref:Autoinducer 2 import system permease protein LsrC n=1 Tax=Marinitenerispora sediminis TaxID=1931232 RepID=A0A368T8R1_9ACTN|nr:ABC transporter permease [Marinitenerispora sediminis]RCV53538.1 ATPase [Marinitenerispora sediminis]RCV57694.1 ATPase [Marinitenerispora sediminis]RCV60749.1 ATPase [Marinitenerispora sediminis]